MKLSIIIPVYNVEKYVGRCLKSCLDQDFDDYEIVIVNDGTPDNSMNVVKDIALRHPNVRIINRPNGGLSAARNTGLADAKGDYVWFVDSDDRIETNCIGQLVNKAEKDQLDVLCFGLKLEYPDGNCMVRNIKHELDGKVYKGEDFICRVEMPPAAWAAIYRRAFLIRNTLKFYEGILHEDQEFTPRAYCLADRISYVNRLLYYYNQRAGSIMKSTRNVKRCRDLLSVAESLYEFATSHLDENSQAYRIFLCHTYFCFTQSLAFYSPEAFPLSHYHDMPFYPMKESLCRGFMIWKLRLANLSLRSYIILYKIFNHQ